MGQIKWDKQNRFTQNGTGRIGQDRQNRIGHNRIGRTEQSEKDNINVIANFLLRITVPCLQDSQLHKISHFYFF
jgi:hypothetical protein